MLRARLLAALRTGTALLALASAGESAAAGPLDAGRFEERAGSRALLIAAPHGGFDWQTEAIARRIASATGAGCLVAIGYRTRQHPWNVNRPTEGVGLASASEPRSPEARAVYEAYAARVEAFAPALYVEIHGNARPASAGFIECATWRISPEEARALRNAYLRRVSALPPGLPRFGLKIEPLDPLHYRAAGAKEHGVFRLVPRGLHFELPVALRVPEVHGPYAEALALALRDAGLAPSP